MEMVRLAPGARTQPVAATGCFGSAATAGQMVWESLLTMVRVRGPPDWAEVPVLVEAPDAVEDVDARVVGDELFDGAAVREALVGEALGVLAVGAVVEAEAG
jgi:hypothetical protein